MKVDLSEAKACAKCGTSKPPIFRHHKGNDGFLAQFNKRIGFNYPKFLDCTHLCLDCHCEIHWLYDKLLIKFWVATSPNGAYRMRKKCIDLCDKWLASKVPKPKIPEKYKARFKQSLEEFIEVSTGTE